MKISNLKIKSISALIVLSILTYIGNESFFHFHSSSITIEISYIQHTDISNDADCLMCDLVKNFQKFSPNLNDLIVINQVSKIYNNLKLNSFIANSSNPIQGRAPPTIKYI